MRLLILDVARIIAIGLVIVHHLFSLEYVPNPFFTIPYYGPMQIGKLGVAMFVFISGAALEMSASTKGTIFNRSNLLAWYGKRALRLYPAMWISCILALLMRPWLLMQQTSTTAIAQLTGVF